MEWIYALVLSIIFGGLLSVIGLWHKYRLDTDETALQEQGTVIVSNLRGESFRLTGPIEVRTQRETASET